MSHLDRIERPGTRILKGIQRTVVSTMDSGVDVEVDFVDFSLVSDTEDVDVGVVETEVVAEAEVDVEEVVTEACKVSVSVSVLIWISVAVTCVAWIPNMLSESITHPTRLTENSQQDKAKEKRRRRTPRCVRRRGRCKNQDGRGQY